MFEKSFHSLKKRKQETFKHQRMKTERHKKSTIPYLSNLLNQDVVEKNTYIKGDF